MRAKSSRSSTIVVVLALVCGCTSTEDATVVVAPAAEPPPAPDPAPPQANNLDDLLRNVQNVRPDSPPQEPLNEIRESTAFEATSPGDAPAQEAVPAKTLDRLIYQCADDVTFAVRIAGDRLEVFPPEHTHGYVVLNRVPSADGVHYTAPAADFRAKDDLATLRIARQIYADCVSNPAASVWQDLPRRVGSTR
jgi:hypothetical protein